MLVPDSVLVSDRVLILQYNSRTLSWARTHTSAMWEQGVCRIVLLVSEKEEGEVALELSIGSFQICFGLEPVPRCEPSIYQVIAPRKPVAILLTTSNHT